MVNGEPDNEEIWRRRGQTQADKFTAHPVKQTFKWGAILLVALICLQLLGGFLGFWGSWLKATTDTVRPENVKAQFAALYPEYEALKATAGNVCDAERSGTAETDNLLFEDPVFTYRAQYRHQTIDYNARYADFFKAAHAGPPDLPKVAPSLEEMKRQVC